MENNTFSYQYSAVRNKEVENIRKKYIVHEESKLDTLKRLDARVQMAGVIESLSIGIIGALVFGIGLCFGLNVLIGADWLTLFFAILGICLMLPAYPVYKHISRKTYNKLAPEILRLSDEIIKS